MTYRPLFHAIVLSIATLLLAGNVYSQEPTPTVLGNDGALYRLQSTTYGEIFGDANGAASGDPVLAVEISRGGQGQDLLLVPETGGPETEDAAFLAYDGMSDTVYLTWERRTNYVHSEILLASLRDGEWSEVIRLSDRRFSLKSSPKVTITRDSYVPPGAAGTDDPSMIQRTVLHAIWYEDRSEGAEVVYAPILVQDGAYVGHHLRIDLSTLFSDEDSLSAPVTNLHNVAPVIRALGQGHFVVAGFVRPESDELSTVRIEVLPGQLSALGGLLRSHILDVGAQHDTGAPEDVQRLADALRSHILDVGARTNPEIVRHIANDLRSHILDVGHRYELDKDEEVRRLAGDLRSHILDVGFRLQGAGEGTQPEDRSVTFDHVGAGAEPSVDTAVFRAEKGLALDLPEVDAEELTLHLSGKGHRAALSWNDDQVLRYQETLAEGWSEAHTLPLGADLDVERARAILVDHLEDQ